MDDTSTAPLADPIDLPALTRQQARRLRDIHRSDGWPSQDALEIELLAAGMLHRVSAPGTSERLRLTDAGVRSLSQALQRNRQALSAHDALVAQVAQSLLRDGRIVWTGLALRARLSRAASTPPDAAQRCDGKRAGAVEEYGNCASASASASEGEGEGEGAAPVIDVSVPRSTQPDAFVLDGCADVPPAARWKICKPDVFSIRNTSVAAYLQPVVHEIKVSRADLLGDLRLPDKRDSYLDLGGQCWYVLGCDARGRPIAQAHEVPPACGVMVAQGDGRLVVVRHAPQRAMTDLPFALWMALAKATPLAANLGAGADDAPDQGLLGATGPVEP